MEFTCLLQNAEQGEKSAMDQVMEVVYLELRKMASQYMGKERSGHTLQPTALVHEAYFRLVDQKQVSWQNRSHFMAMAATVMRRVLVDHARKKGAVKRGDGVIVEGFDEDQHGSAKEEDVVPLDVLALDQALDRLKELNARVAKLVELRLFAGVDLENIAQALSISLATAKRDWSFAKAFLRRELDTHE